jgi:hypothetical protein
MSERGIEANLEKISAITNMGPIKDHKGVQRVMGITPLVLRELKLWHGIICIDISLCIIHLGCIH